VSPADIGAPTLFDEPPRPKLTEKQAFGLEHVRQFEEGVTADELGALLHERRRVHAAGERCDWCASEGRSILEPLRRKGLLIRRRTGLWQITRVGRGVRVDTERTPPPSRPSQQQSAYDPASAPWPTGF